MTLTTTKTKIGPRHHGRKMSLKAFEFAQVEDGYLYELARGYVIVAEVPNIPHALRTSFIRTHLGHYDVENPNALYAVRIWSSFAGPRVSSSAGRDFSAHST